MDSMRSLNTSLPSARRRPQPPAQLLQAFKTAALQVTNLYKAAATDRDHAHEDGYQAALEDMLSFLDAENLGVGDGEGWRVRQWVTEKLQEGMANNAAGLDSDDDQGDDDKCARSSSPAVQRRTAPDDRSSAPAAPAPVVASISPEPVIVPDRPAFDISTPPKADFTFRSTQSLPAHHDLDMERSAAEHDDDEDQSDEANGAAPMQINLFPRHHSRAASHRSSAAAAHRAHHHARDGSNRSNAAATAAAVAQMNSLGQSAGMKRRTPMGEFFDISGAGNGKDGFGGGGKRGRFT